MHPTPARRARAFTLVEMPAVSRRERAAFTLVEMLVVLGIIIVIVGILVPVLAKSRRSSRQAACASNLRQIGQMVLMYAEANNDYITVGHTFMLEHYDPGSGQMRGQGGHDWSCYPIAHGVPSAGLGPLFLCGMLSQENAKILYCPTDGDERLEWKLWQPKIPARKREPAPGLTIRISYFCRPVNNRWIHTRLSAPKPAAIWPVLLTRMDDLRNKAIYSERLAPPYPHGSDTTPMVNVLYQDGSVRASFRQPSNSGSPVLLLPDELPTKPMPLPGAWPDKAIGSDSVMVPGWSLLDSEYGK